MIERPAACAITSVSLDHREMLGDTLAEIAAEKAGILKSGVPVVVGAQAPVVRDVILGRAQAVGAPVLLRGRDWDVAADRAGGFRYQDAAGSLDLPPPALPGLHQLDNAGIAICALRNTLRLADAGAIARGVASAEWPARLQRLHGALARILPERWELWLDGGHNPGAAEVLAVHLAQWAADRPVHLVVGMKQAKDSAEFLRRLLPHAASAWAVAEPGQHLALPVEDIVAASGGVARRGLTVTAALDALATGGGPPARVLVCGSLYLAGEVLKRDGRLSGTSPMPAFSG